MIKTVIKNYLINDAVKKAIQVSVIKTEAETYSRLKCSSACEKLLNYY